MSEIVSDLGREVYMLVKNRIITIFAVAFIASSALGDELIEGLKSRDGGLHRMSVRFSHKVETDPDPLIYETSSDEMKKHTRPLVAHLEMFDVLVRRLDDSYYFEIRTSPETLKLKDPSPDASNQLSIAVMSPRRWESLRLPKGAKRALGGITPGGDIPHLFFIDVAIGLRLSGFAAPLLKNDHLKWTQVPEGDDIIKLTGKTEKGEIHTIRFSRKLGWALVSYHIEYGKKEDFEEIVCDDFRAVDGLMLPFRITRDGEYIDLSNKPRHPFKHTIIVNEWLRDDAGNTLDSMFIKWPKGSIVGDIRNGNQQIRVRDDDTILTDEAIFSIIKEREEGNPDKLKAAQRKIDEVLSKPATQPAKAVP